MGWEENWGPWWGKWALMKGLVLEYFIHENHECLCNCNSVTQFKKLMKKERHFWVCLPCKLTEVQSPAPHMVPSDTVREHS